MGLAVWGRGEGTVYLPLMAGVHCCDGGVHVGNVILTGRWIWVFVWHCLIVQYQQKYSLWVSYVSLVLYLQTGGGGGDYTNPKKKQKWDILNKKSW